MNIERLAISVAALLLTTASLAADPTASSTAPPLQAPAAPLGVEVPAAAKSSGAPIGPAVAATTDAAATAKAAHALGYTPRQRSGKTVYCKAEASIGTRLESTKCFTPEEMTAVVQRSIQNQESLSKLQRTELYQQGKQ